MSYPFELDILEQVAECGELDVTIALMMAKNPPSLWHALGAMAASQAVTVWVREPEGERPLESWEVQALLRARTTGSAELLFGDASLVLRPGNRIEDAYPYGS